MYWHSCTSPNTFENALSVVKHYVNQGLSHPFCKGSDGNYFILCRPYGLSLLFSFKVNMVCGPQFITPDVICQGLCWMILISFFVPVPVCIRMQWLLMVISRWYEKYMNVSYKLLCTLKAYATFRIDEWILHGIYISRHCIYKEQAWIKSTFSKLLNTVQILGIKLIKW